MLLFTDAEPANFGDGVVGCSSFENIPVDIERNVVPFETSDIGTECVDVRVVLVVSGLHVVVSATSVGMDIKSIRISHVDLIIFVRDKRRPAPIANRDVELTT